MKKKKTIEEKINLYEKIYNDKQNGFTNKKLAKYYNLSKSTIEDYLKQYKIFLFINKDKDKFKSLSINDKKEILNKINSIINYKEKIFTKSTLMSNDEYINHLNDNTNYIWNFIPDCKNYYIINNNGTRIFDIINDRELSIFIDLNYTYTYIKNINLYKPIKTRIDKLIYNTFIEKIYSNNIVYHKDNNTLNNDYTNLSFTNLNINSYNLDGINKMLLNTQKIYNINKYNTIEEIAKKYNTSCNYIKYNINIHTTLLKMKDKILKKKNDIAKNIKLYEQIYNDRQSGLKIKSLIEKYNLSKSTIEDYIKLFTLYLNTNKNIDKYLELTNRKKEEIISNTKNISNDNNKIDNVYEILNNSNIKAMNNNNFIIYLNNNTNYKWKQIYNFSNYVINDNGKFIINLNTKKLVSIFQDRGYLYSHLYSNEKKKHIKLRVNRLIYSTFIEPINQEIVIHHKDQNKINNHYKNLLSTADTSHGKYHSLTIKDSLLDQLKTIYELHENGMKTRDIAKKFNYSIKTIQKKLKTYKKHLIAKNYNDKNICQEEINTNYKIENVKKDLELYEKIYNDKYENGLSNKELMERYKLKKSTIDKYIRTIKTYICPEINKDIDKFINLSVKEKTEIFNRNYDANKEKVYDFLINDCKYLYNLKYKNNLLVKEISKKYNLEIMTINYRIRQWKYYLAVNQNLDKYISLSKEDKKELLNNDIKIKEKIESTKQYLTKCKEFYDLRYKDNLSVDEIINKTDLSETNIRASIRQWKIYLNINEDIYKYIALSKEDKEVITEKRLEKDRIANRKGYLEKCKVCYDLKYKNHLSAKKISVKLKMIQSTVEVMIKNYIIFISDEVNKDINIDISLSEQDRIRIINDLQIKNYLTNNIELGKKIEQDKLNHLTNKKLAEKYNLNIRTIKQKYDLYIKFKEEQDTIVELDKRELCEKVYNLYKENISLRTIMKKLKLNLFYVVLYIDTYKRYFKEQEEEKQEEEQEEEKQ